MNQVVEPEAESLVAEIAAAFADVPRGRLSLRQAKIAKFASAAALAEARLQDTDRRWSEISDVDLETGGNALYVDDPESWRYFIPAFMVWTLHNFRVNDSFVIDQTIYAFDVPANDDMRREAKLRFETLSNAQRRVVFRFLSYMSRYPDHVDDVVAKRALENYWAKFCSDAELPE